MDSNDYGKSAKNFVLGVIGFVGLGAMGIAAQRVINAGADAAGSSEEVGLL